MDNTTRGALYLRGRADLTPAQRRRFDKHESRDDNRVARQGRIRRTFLSREARRVRREGANLVAAVRAGYFRSRKRSLGEVAGIARRDDAA